MVEKHAREYEPVVHLHHSHLCLVHLHVDTQSVASGGHALVDHLMDIRVQFLDQVEIALCQLLLVMERHHLPVGHINMVERSLTSGIERILCYSFIDISHLVEGDDTTTHEDGLSEKDTTCPDITCIGIQGIHDLLPLGIQDLLETSRQSRHVLLQVAHHPLHLSRGHAQLHEGITHLGKRVLKSSHLRLQTSYSLRTHLGQTFLLGVVQQ